MSFLIDTSAMVHLLRDRKGDVAREFDEIAQGESVLLSDLTVFELLRGARDAKEWTGLAELIEKESVISAEAADWRHAARIVFDLRRGGLTLKNSVDCLVAQMALKHDLELIHDDADFELIARMRPLRLRRLQLQ